MLCLLLATGGCGPKLSIDTTAEAAAAAGRLQSGSPSPAWMSLVEARDFIFLTAVPGNRILAASWVTGVYWISHNHRDAWPDSLILFDATSGQVVWQQSIREEDDYSKRISLLAATPVVVLRADLVEFDEDHSSRLDAFDAGTGAPVWSRAFGLTDRASAIADLGLVVLTSFESDGAHLTAVRMSDGAEVWTTTLESAIADPLIGLDFLPVGGRLLVQSRGVSALDAATGQASWSLGGTEGRRAVVQPFADVLALGAGQDLAWVSLADGRELGRVALAAGPVETVFGTATHIFVVSGSGSQSAVTAIDRTTGVSAWSQALGELLWSNLVADESSLFVTTPTRILALALADGSRRFEWAVPAGLMRRGELPFVLALVGENVVVGGESGVAAFRRDNGWQVFAHAIQGATATTTAFTGAKLRAMLNRSTPDADEDEAAAAARGLVSSNSTVQAQIQSMQWSWLQGYVQWNTSLTSQTLGSSSATSFDRSMALSGQFTSQMTAAAVGNIQAAGNALVVASMAAAQIASAGLSAAAQLADIGTTVRREFQLALVQLQCSVAASNHAQSITGKWYVRPFYADGWGFAVVDLETGGRADLRVAPPDSSMTAAEYVNIPLFAVDPASQRLFVKGPSLYPTQWKTYEIPAWPEGIFGETNWRLPHPFVQAYALDQLPYAAAALESANVAEPAALSPDESLLFTAALKGAEDLVEELLARGVDPNAQDEYGRTALMMAALSGETDAIEVLAEHGADVSAVDVEGLWALEYTLLFPVGQQWTDDAREAIRDIVEAAGGR